MASTVKVFPPVRAITERFVSTETAPTQVDGRCFLDDISVGVLNDDSAGNLIGAILQGRDDYALDAHGEVSHYRGASAC